MRQGRKQLIIATVGVCGLLAIGPSVSGQARERVAQAVSSKLSLTMEQRHIIKEFIKERKVADEPSNVDVKVGGVIPKTVQLQTMPADVAHKVSQVRNYSYFKKNDQLVLVDPKDNKVVDVIDVK